MKEQDFIQKICGYAISDMKENGVLASVTIAQAIDKLQNSLDDVKKTFGEVLEVWRLQRS